MKQRELVENNVFLATVSIVFWAMVIGVSLFKMIN